MLPSSVLWCIRSSTTKTSPDNGSSSPATATLLVPTHLAPSCRSALPTSCAAVSSPRPCRSSQSLCRLHKRQARQIVNVLPYVGLFPSAANFSFCCVSGLFCSLFSFSFHSCVSSCLCIYASSCLPPTGLTALTACTAYAGCPPADLSVSSTAASNPWPTRPPLQPGELPCVFEASQLSPTRSPTFHHTRAPLVSGLSSLCPCNLVSRASLASPFAFQTALRSVVS